MKYIFCLLLMFDSVVLIGCATTRTKWSDKNMRVMVDPEAIPKQHYVKLVQALIDSDNWTVVDRRDGIKAIKHEQENLHRDEQDRYEDKEKWAHWGELYGVGAIIVPTADCRKQQNFIFNNFWYLDCEQYLQLVDANTGEIIISVQDRIAGETYHGEPFAPEWTKIVENLYDRYPRVFKNEEYHEKIQEYQKKSEELAKRRGTK